jgi:hypothetical protein
MLLEAQSKHKDGEITEQYLSILPPSGTTATFATPYMNSACIVCIAGGLEGLRPSKKNPRMHALLQEIILLTK